MLLLTLNSSFVAALTISAIARLVTYGATCLALPVLRRQHDAPPASFRLHYGTFIAILALLLAAWLLANSTWKEARAATIAAAVGLLVYFSYRWLGRGGPAARAKPEV